MENFKVEEHFVAHVDTTYLDETKSSRPRRYLGGVFLEYPTSEDLRKIAEKFLRNKEEGKIDAISINHISVEKRYQIYTESQLKEMEEDYKRWLEEEGIEL
jgi:hypothetical protein